MPNLIISINCGKETCASEPGEFCQYVWTERKPKVPMLPTGRYFCQIFNVLLEDTGWLQRCQACLDAEGS